MKRLAVLIGLFCALCAAVPAAQATFNGTLYVTNFVSHNVDSVKIASGAVVGGSQGTLNTVAGADGIVCRNKNLVLLIGGQLSNNVFQMNPTTGAYTRLNTVDGACTGGAFLTSLNNDESALYTTGLTTNGLAIVDYATGTTTTHNIAGTTTGVVSGIGFDAAGNLYITDSPNTGTGQLYSVNQTTWAVTALTGVIPSAHGISYDAYTGHLLIAGGDWIQEFAVTPTTATLIRQWDCSALVGHPDAQAHLDQGWTDGKGNFFAASNSGPLVYLDLTAATPAPVSAGSLGYGADDVTGCIVNTPPPPPPCTNNALSWGFWKHQCSVHGFHQVNGTTMGQLFSEIASSGSKVFGPGGCFTPGCDLFNTKFKSDMQGKAAQQYLALLCNLDAKLVSGDCIIVCSGGPEKVSDVIATIEAGLCVPGQKTSYYAQFNDLAECGNTYAESNGGGGGDQVFSDESDAGTTGPAFGVERVGANPSRLSQGGVNFRISSNGSLNIVRLGIYDATGRMVAQPVRDRAITGESTVNWNGVTLRGTRAAAGTYFYRATGNGQVVTGRFMLLP